MIKMKKSTKKLTLTKVTVVNLDARGMKTVKAGEVPTTENNTVPVLCEDSQLTLNGCTFSVYNDPNQVEKI